MTIDMTNNRVPYGLLTDEEKAALHEHKKAGGKFEYCTSDAFGWGACVIAAWFNDTIYRTVTLPKTQDVIAWDRLPDWVQWVARDEGGVVWGYDEEPECNGGSRRGGGWWMFESSSLRIDDFPGIVQIGTCDWTSSKQRRPQG
jgi:hypothetical protein